MPKEITPKMKRFSESYKKKAKDDTKLARNINNYFVDEWEDGWMEYKIIKGSLLINTLHLRNFRNKKFLYMYNMAKKLNLSSIVFLSKRNPKAWKRILRRYKDKIATKIAGKVEKTGQLIFKLSFVKEG